MNDQQSVLEFVMEAGEVLLKNGAEVSRTQQTIDPASLRLWTLSAP